MKYFLFSIIVFFGIISNILCGCGRSDKGDEGKLLFDNTGYPFLTYNDGEYYFTFQNNTVDSIILISSPTVEGLSNAERKCVWRAADNGMKNIYSPELHRLDDKWYIYFEADDGVNTDNHQLFVLENPADIPTEGTWTLHGPIITDPEWNFGLHPTLLTVAGRNYLLWSGWPKRRTETETQCIYIGELENPWTLKSERVMISEPEYEWERQWINPDGSRTSYPIYVNENPEAMLSPDGRSVVVGYSASGIWTEYSTLGLLKADVSSDLLDPESWRKDPEPYSGTEDDRNLFGISNITMLKDPDSDKWYILYQGKYKDEQGYSRNKVLMKKIGWRENGIPDFGFRP